MKKKKPTKIVLELELETWKRLNEVSKLSGVSKNEIINVILAIEIISNRFYNKHQK